MKDKNKPYLKMTLKLTKRDGKVKRYRKGTFRRFLYSCRHGSWEKYYLWVGYGKQKDVYGKMTEFYNDGEYTNRKDAEQALRAFCES